jgi:hypothetical protein
MSPQEAATLEPGCVVLHDNRELLVVLGWPRGHFVPVADTNRRTMVQPEWLRLVYRPEARPGILNGLG